MARRRFAVLCLVIVMTMAYTGLLLGTIAGKEANKTIDQNDLDLEDPIAFIGHGAMYDPQGNKIEPTTDLLLEAQQYYLTKLYSLASPEQREQLRAKQAAIFGVADLDQSGIMIVNAALTDWLIDVVSLDDAGALEGKNNLIRSLIQDMPATADDRPSAGYSELSSLLEEHGLVEPPATEIEIMANREEYLQQCDDADVPRPPDWDLTSSEWTHAGEMSDAELFLEADQQTDVYVYKSDTPRGVCLALPRSEDGKINLLGIICLGKKGNACFWDNQQAGVNQPFSSEEVRPIADFAGGPELFGGTGGICTDCHRGENPFPIHPNTNLDPRQWVRSDIGWAIEDLTLFQPDNWYTPTVDASWPQNPGPLDLAPPDGGMWSCTGCHLDSGPAEIGYGAGRFPEMTPAHGPGKQGSNRTGGYCATVLQNAIYRTMPPGPPILDPRPDIKEFAGHVYALLSECPQPLGPVAKSTLSVNIIRAAHGALSYTIVISNHFPVTAAVTAGTVTVSNTLGEQLTLVPETVEFDLGTGVTETAAPLITVHGLNWYGALESSSMLTITYVASFDARAAEGPLVNDLVVTDGLAPPVLLSVTSGPYQFAYLPFGTR